MLSLPRTQLPYLSFCPSFPQGPKDFSAANHGNEKNRTYLQKKKSSFLPPEETVVTLMVFNNTFIQW